MPTDTREKGLETLIVESLVNEADYVLVGNADYSREHVIDLARLRAFLEATQPETAESLALDQDCPKRTQFLHRLDAEIAKRGVIDVLRFLIVADKFQTGYDEPLLHTMYVDTTQDFIRH